MLAVAVMRLILLMALGWTGVAVAQEKPPTLATSFYCFQYAPGLRDVYVRTGAVAFQKVELSTANLLGPMAVVSTGGAVTVHRQEEDAEGNTVYPVVGTARIGASVRKPLVVLLPGPKGEKAVYRTLVLDRSEARFPLGSFQLVNLATHPVRGLVGGSRVALKPGGVANVKPGGDPGQMVNVLFEYHDGERWRPMTKTRWAVRDDRRTLMCAYVDPKNGRVNIRSIPERLVPVEEGP